jgi:hypothetical protein
MSLTFQNQSNSPSLKDAGQQLMKAEQKEKASEKSALADLDITS